MTTSVKPFQVDVFVDTHPSITHYLDKRYTVALVKVDEQGEVLNTFTYLPNLGPLTTTIVQAELQKKADWCMFLRKRGII